MENIGLDLHQRESQLCLLTDDGEVIERRIRTTPERLTAVLGPRAPARILLEASTESEWVARHLEALGHTVIVADPNYAPMYATRSGRAELAPLMALLPGLDQEIAAADQRLVQYLAADPVVRRLATAPGIGPVTATAFVATLDEITRLATAHQVEAYLGLVPSERSSDERQRRGRITKAGNTRMRWLLVEAAWRVLRSPRADAAPLRGRGPSGSRSAGASGSRWSPWPDGWRACSTRCGGTERAMPRDRRRGVPRLKPKTPRLESG